MFSRVEPVWISAPEGLNQTDSIALLSSIRIRRNIDGFSFPGKSSRSDLYDSAAIVLGSTGRGAAWDRCDFRMIDNLDNMSRYLLLEMRLITPQMAGGGPGKFFLRDDAGKVSCMINEEDHISISVTNAGLDLITTLDAAGQLENSLDIDLARDTVLGFLTANPAYVGTGLTASVMLHLPALDATGEMQRVCEAFERDWKKLALYKLLSDKENISGSFYLLSNRTTLAMAPDEIVNMVDDAAQSLISKELFSRHKLMSTKNIDIIDKFWRSWGLLRHARKLSFSEAVDTFSFVKLGSDLGVLPAIDNAEWRRQVISAQRYHLSLASQQILEQSEEPYVRATRFRQFIENKSASM